MNIAAPMLEPHEYAMIDLIHNFLWLELFDHGRSISPIIDEPLQLLTRRQNCLCKHTGEIRSARFVIESPRRETPFDNDTKSA